MTARSYDAGQQGAELIESFTPGPAHRGFAQLRRLYSHDGRGLLRGLDVTEGSQALPDAQRRARIDDLLALLPLVTAIELVTRFLPGAARWRDRLQRAYRENW